MEGMNISNLGHPRGLIQVGEEKGGRGIYYAHWRLDKCSVMIRDFPSLAKKKIFKPYLWNMHLRWHWTKRFFHLGRLHHWIVSRWVLSIKRWHSRSGMSWHCHMTWSCNTMTGTCFNLELRKVCSLVFPFTFLVAPWKIFFPLTGCCDC